MITPARFEDEVRRITENGESVLEQIEAFEKLKEDTLVWLGYERGVELMRTYLDN